MQSPRESTDRLGREARSDRPGGDPAKGDLTIDALIEEAAQFAAAVSSHQEPELYGVTDGKAIGTYLEDRFRRSLEDRYTFAVGSAAKGIDFPGLGVDIKTTSLTQPQSSSPFESPRQKVHGLGHSLLIFVYRKSDDQIAGTARLEIVDLLFVDQSRTADYQMTRGLREVISLGGNADDLVAFMNDRLLPIDDAEAVMLAEELLRDPPRQGYLTISNALQWRLQYGRVIEQAGKVDGVKRIRSEQ